MTAKPDVEPELAESDYAHHKNKYKILEFNSHRDDSRVRMLEPAPTTEPDTALESEPVEAPVPTTEPKSEVLRTVQAILRRLGELNATNAEGLFRITGDQVRAAVTAVRDFALSRSALKLVVGAGRGAAAETGKCSISRGRPAGGG